MNHVHSNHCGLCQRLDLARKGENFHFVRDLGTSALFVGDHQFFRGYCVLVAKRHVRELHQMSSEDGRSLHDELMHVCAIITKTFDVHKINLASFGNIDEHVHWHIIPRYAEEPDDLRRDQPFRNASQFAQHKTTPAQASEIARALIAGGV